MSTIAAISSPVGVGGIGIVRVCGEQALEVANAIFSFQHKPQEWKPLMLNYGTFLAADFSDKGYAVYFPAKKAYTGEDTVEFYLHGGVRIMQGALSALLEHGAVMAKNGEFTKRAFLSGRLSLADAEGVIDMINAESAAGLRAAYRLMDGAVSKKINNILDRLEVLIATLEASLDYPDEMEDEVLPIIPVEIEHAYNEVCALLKTAANGKIAKYGLTVCLAGNTNAGKSSLMNALLQEDRAIVTSIAGTTRDTVTESFEYHGVKINLIDTAGIRESSDEVESIGIERAKKAFEGADVILHVIDANEESDDMDFGDKKVFTIYNKCDIATILKQDKKDTFYISAKTKDGVEDIANALASLYKENELDGGEVITSQRHISALHVAKNALANAKINVNQTIDLIITDLEEAYNALGEITGKTAKEDVVDSIFARFCVGK